jgi:hypothetical protein
MLPPAVPPADESSAQSSTPRPPSTQPLPQAQNVAVSRTLRSQQASSPAASAGSPPHRVAATPTAAASSPQAAPPPSPTRGGASKGRGAVAQKKGPAKRKPSTTRANAAAPPPAQAPVEIVDDASSPAGTSAKRQRQEELTPPENNPGEADEPSPKRSKVGEAEVQPEVTANDALAAAVAVAMQSPENALTFHEAALANFGDYNPLGSLAAGGAEEITVRDVGGAGAPSLDELLQRVQTQVVSTSDGLISSALAGPSTSPWLQRESDPMWLSSIGLRNTSSTNASTLYDGGAFDGAFDISDFLDVSNLAYEDGDEALRITATPELANSSQGPTPNSILESPAGAGLSRPLESSPKGLRETATDRPLATFARSDFMKDISIPEGSHYHRGIEWMSDGDMASSDWPISYEDRIVSSTA